MIERELMSGEIPALALLSGWMVNRIMKTKSLCETQTEITDLGEGGLGAIVKNQDWENKDSLMQNPDANLA